MTRSPRALQCVTGALAATPRAVRVVVLVATVCVVCVLLLVKPRERCDRLSDSTPRFIEFEILRRISVFGIRSGDVPMSSARLVFVEYHDPLAESLAAMGFGGRPAVLRRTYTREPDGTLIESDELADRIRRQVEEVRRVLKHSDRVEAEFRTEIKRMQLRTDAYVDK